MNQLSDKRIVDSFGNDISSSKTLWQRSQPLLKIVKYAGVTFCGLVTGMVIFTGNVKTLWSTVFPAAVINHGFIREIPQDQLPEISYRKCNINPLLKLPILRLDVEARTIDLCVLNFTVDPIIVSQVILDISPSPRQCRWLVPSGDVQTTISNDELIGLTDKDNPIEIRKGIEVSYTVPPKTADRYRLKLNVERDDLLFGMEADSDFDFRLTASLKINGTEWISKSVSWKKLLAGKDDDDMSDEQPAPPASTDKSVDQVPAPPDDEQQLPPA